MCIYNKKVCVCKDCLNKYISAATYPPNKIPSSVPECTFIKVWGLKCLI